MLSVIHLVAGATGIGRVAIAGAPLVARQIQWLRAIGCERIAVEIGADTGSGEVIRWLEEHEALLLDVVTVFSRAPLGAREVALRAGFPPELPLLAVPADVIGDGDLTRLFLSHSGGGDVVAHMGPPAALGRMRSAAVRLVAPDSSPSVRSMIGPGWAARIGSVEEAMAVGAAVLRRQLPPADGEHAWPIQVHAAEVAPGIWLSRGARIEPGATVVAPVLVGANALVRAGATVGPATFLGERAIVEAGATAVESEVAAGVIVGEGLELRRCVATTEHVTELATQQMVQLDDGLLLGARDGRSIACVASRLVALALLLLLGCFAAPLLLARRGRGLSWRTVVIDRPCGRRRLHYGTTGSRLLDLLPALLDVVAGERALVGVRPSVAAIVGGGDGLLREARLAPCGAFDVEPVLTDGEHDPTLRLRALAWYAYAKCARLDAALVFRLLRG